jgi:hypothetical protein
MSATPAELAPAQETQIGVTMTGMTTEADIEHLIESCTEAMSTILYGGAGDRELIRTHVRATLLYLAVGSHTLGCYDTLDDLIWYLTARRRT